MMTDDMLQDGDLVEIYWNLHKDCFSVRRKGKVVDYLYGDDYLTLTDVEFVVQKAGRERVLREKRKNVHAFVRGTIRFSEDCATQQKATYNPYFMDSFYTKLGGNITPVHKARSATLTDHTVYINP